MRLRMLVENSGGDTNIIIIIINVDRCCNPRRQECDSKRS
jgi:hypothetical protein